MNLISEQAIITRTGAGTYVNGLYVKGTQTTINTLVSCQPLSMEETLQVPEADRKRENYKIYCQDELLINDILERSSDNKKFIIKDRGNWSVFGALSHWKCRGVLEGS